MKDIFKQYEALKAANVNVDMTRGRPSKQQLDIALPMLDAAGLCYTYQGGDARNYGDPYGVPAARELFAELMGVDFDMTAAFDGSSLSIMYDLIAFHMDFGIGGKAWRGEQAKFICPSPGYDRHFAICAEFGIDMITVPLLEDGPDMDMVEELVKDPAVKGIWCVPKFSNPTGITYSEETVRRMAALKPAAENFRVFWDNAYIVHFLDEDVPLANIFDYARQYHSENMIYELCSTSKITFAGSGVSALATGRENLAEIIKRISIRIINHNKVNQVMHVSFLKSVDHIGEIMAEHSKLLLPKFRLFDEKMTAAFKGDDRVRFSKPHGGYFISLDVKGVAKRVVELAAGAGVKFTAAGATYPYSCDPYDSNIRIAPSVPTLEEMDFAIDVLIASIRIALFERDGK